MHVLLKGWRHDFHRGHQFNWVCLFWCLKRMHRQQSVLNIRLSVWQAVWLTCIASRVHSSTLISLRSTAWLSAPFRGTWVAIRGNMTVFSPGKKDSSQRRSRSDNDTRQSYLHNADAMFHKTHPHSKQRTPFPKAIPSRLALRFH